MGNRRSNAGAFKARPFGKDLRRNGGLAYFRRRPAGKLFRRASRPAKALLPSAENWASSLPGTIGNLVRRYGWLAGVYIALGGLGIAIIGIIAKIAVSSMFKSFGSFGGMGYYGDFSGFGGGSNSLNSFATNNPVSIMAAAMIIIGIVITAAGAVLAFYLKNKGKGGDK